MDEEGACVSRSDPDAQALPNSNGSHMRGRGREPENESSGSVDSAHVLNNVPLLILRQRALPR